MVPSVLAQFCPDPGFSIAFFSHLGPKPATEPSPDPPKLPGTAGVLPGPSLGAENRQNLQVRSFFDNSSLPFDPGVLV